MTATAAPGREELLALADEEAAARARYHETDAVLIRESEVREYALRFAAKPSDEGVRKALFKREPRVGGYTFVTAPAFPGWNFMLTPVCPEAREKEMRLSLVTFLEAEAVLSAPVPSPNGAGKPGQLPDANCPPEGYSTASEQKP